MPDLNGDTVTSVTAFCAGRYQISHSEKFGFERCYEAEPRGLRLISAIPAGYFGGLEPQEKLSQISGPRMEHRSNTDVFRAGGRASSRVPIFRNPQSDPVEVGVS